MGPKQRAFLDGFARIQAFIDELLNLGNGWFLFLSMGAAYVVLQLLQLLDIVTQEAVAILFTFAVILGADLYLFVVVGKARGHWLDKGHRWAAVLWSVLAAYLLLINYESLYAYQLMWGMHITEEQAFRHVLWGLSIQDFWNERALLLAMLAMVAALTRHQRAEEAGAYKVDVSTTPPPQPAGPVSPGPSGKDRRSGVPAREQLARSERRWHVASAYLDSHPKASQDQVLTYLKRQGLECSESTVNGLIKRYRALEAQSIQLVAPEEVA